MPLHVRIIIHISCFFPAYHVLDETGRIRVFTRYAGARIVNVGEEPIPYSNIGKDRQF